MKKTLTVLTLTLGLANSQAALILNLTDFTAVGGGTADSGALTATTVPTLSGPNGAPFTPQQAVYSYSVTGLSIDGQAGYDLTFDMTVDAGAGNSLTTQTGFWMIDRGADGGNPDAFRVTSEETLTISVSNLAVVGPTVANASFDGFTGITANQNPGAAVIDLDAGTFSSTQAESGPAGHRYGQVDFQISLTATPIPEPSSVTLLGLGCLGCLALHLRRLKAVSAEKASHS